MQLGMPRARVGCGIALATEWWRFASPFNVVHARSPQASVQLKNLRTYG